LASAAGGADARWVLTSRNFGLALRRAVAVRRPDLIKSNGGGCNAILVRGVVAEHRTRRLCRWPERRWLHAARVSTDGGSVWTGNLHCTVRNPSAALREGRLAAAVMRSWAGEAPVVLGGDFNERGLALDGYRCLANHDVDYVFGSGGLTGCAAELLNRGRLSDHAPVAVTVEV
jgi:endonuclease/exonuclease/phosphatase family metal-dependent hydrolase